MKAFPYAPHITDETRLTPWLDHSGTGEYGPEFPVSIRNAVADRNTMRVALANRLQFDLAVERLHPDARIYGDRFGAIAIDRKTQTRVGSYTRDAQHACIHYPAGMRI